MSRVALVHDFLLDLRGAERVFAAMCDLWPDADVYTAARELAARYASGPALALRAAKQAVNQGLEVDLVTGLEIERLQFAALFATEDQKTGMCSFMEQGPGKARFEGR